jgi:hypothetical protein
MKASRAPSRKRPTLRMTLDSIGNQGVRQDAGRIPNGEVDESFDGSFQAPSSIPGYRYELLNFFVAMLQFLVGCGTVPLC